ncbi:IclR family transcriptional regulator C-terminal domain-containing protein [Streptomyces turgidiscabies]|uniref:Transcriptional regulator, IclR family, C-terminal domain protein n=1 Tax=Streptomyces turgidiscabies (strain Car8) TaxID=698760 RepID=L7FJR9_STRT8|nr:MULTISPECIES: IclR family transcriptional regulator C-terminal domain-containing protein [Streptomyces]ELP71331.1 transcriptional regulator, IclR family, C-terminal domain protein [Streptomyces turgidiscabies Car8]MDX3492281.1 IclR family transcriptional regulator C-terminal domain-containing protein [Streptomyces turgidiscabies]GAQ69427.1 acetate operon repressor [Streptomyces turgidiscabies]
MHEELARIRADGYAVDDVENEQDIRCVAAPVYDHKGEVSIAVSISGPAARVTRDRLPELGALLSAATGTITESLGGAVRAAEA